MIPWLDFKIFGGGRGLAQPYFDGRFYWLVDTLRKDRNGRNGQFYKFGHGFGAQLDSYQWTHPKAGERRRLAGREFVVFHSSRRWFRVAVAWALVGLPRDTDAANATIRALEQDLGRTP